MASGHVVQLGPSCRVMLGYKRPLHAMHGPAWVNPRKEQVGFIFFQRQRRSLVGASSTVLYV